MVSPSNSIPQDLLPTEIETETQQTGAPGQLGGRGPIAIIDIGSNSVRLVVYERLNRSPTIIFNEKVLAGLGRGIAETERLDDEAVAMALAALRRFCQLMRQLDVVETHVLATAAAREASNGADFIEEVEALCETKVRILSGQEEALFSAYGIVAGTLNADGVVGDLGGGSLELVDVQGHDIGPGRTYPLGGLRLQDLSAGNIKKAGKLADTTLNNQPILKKNHGRAFYAIGGTWRSLAKLHMEQTDYPLHVMHNYVMAPDEALELCQQIMQSDLADIPGIEAVSKNRQSLLPFGAATLSQVIRHGEPSQIVFSALGVREGFLYSLLDDDEREKDPLLVSAGELSVLRSRSPAHAQELRSWTDGLFSVLRISETEEERRLRHAACLLSDIGWRAHADYRGEQSLNIIAHAAFTGLDHAGRAYLAMAIYYRHEGLINEDMSPRVLELASVRLQQRARLLGVALRLAFLLSASKPGYIDQVSFSRDEDTLILTLPADLAALDGERLNRRLRQFSRIVGLTSRVDIAP